MVSIRQPISNSFSFFYTLEDRFKRTNYNSYHRYFQVSQFFYSSLTKSKYLYIVSLDDNFFFILIFYFIYLFIYFCHLVWSILKIDD